MQLFHIGGMVNESPTRSVYVYSSGSWTPATPLPEPRAQLMCTVLDCQGLICGGITATVVSLFSTLFHAPHCREAIRRAVTFSTATASPTALRCSTTSHEQTWSHTEVSDVSLFKAEHQTNAFARQSVYTGRLQMRQLVMLRGQQVGVS